TGNSLVATSDRTSDRPAGDVDERAARARAIAARRREEGRRNRSRVAAYITAHPEATTREIADATGLSEATVRRIRRSLRGEG
ncbi:MAG UNVERIFIED_CONTAM: winged helix-turn-helix domain-containing protein, partial [Thermobifida fusca]